MNYTVTFDSERKDKEPCSCAWMLRRKRTNHLDFSEDNPAHAKVIASVTSCRIRTNNPTHNTYYTARNESGEIIFEENNMDSAKKL